MALAEIIAKVDQLKSEIEALRPLAPDQQARIMQKFRLDWSYHSNAIEGNTLTLGETRAFLLHGLTAKGKPFRDYLDIKGHNKTMPNHVRTSTGEIYYYATPEETPAHMGDLMQWFEIRYSLQTRRSEQLISDNYNKHFSEEDVEKLAVVIATKLYDLIEEQTKSAN